MMTSRTVLVTAASGHIGQHLIPALLNDHAKLVLPTSSAERLKSSLPSEATEEKVFVEEGNVNDAFWIEKIIKSHNVDTVFVCFSGPSELITTLNFFDAMERAGTVKHLVYLSAASDLSSDAMLNATIGGSKAMHVLIKPLIERKLKHSNYPWTHTIVGPTMFWDNDYTTKESVIHSNNFNVPTPPIGYSRVAPLDIAAVVRKAVLEPEKWNGKKINVGTRHTYTNADHAKLWSDALGKEIRVLGVDDESLEQYETTLTGFLKKPYGELAPAWARDLRLMCQSFSYIRFGLNEEEYKLQVECLGREPLPYEQFVAETAKEWKA